MTEKPSILRSTVFLMVLSVLSPVAGMALQMALAYVYGAGPMIDGFRVGILLVEFGKQFFLGQIVVAVIVPVLTEHRAGDDMPGGLRLAFTSGVILLLLLSPAILIGLLAPSVLQGFLAPGLEAAGAETARFFLRVFALTLVVLCFTGIANGILHGYRVFWLSRTRQIVRNLLVILCVVALGAYLGRWAIAAGVLAGTVLGALIGGYWLVRAVRSSDVPLREMARLRLSPELVEMGKTALPLIGALVAAQWFMVVLYRSMSAFPAGTLANFGYSWKLRQLGTLLPICLSTVLFPSFSECAAEGRVEVLRRLCGRFTRFILFLSVPTAVFIYVCARPLSDLVFLRGEMTVEETRQIALFLGIFAFAFPADAIAMLAMKVSFAMKDSLGPCVRQVITAGGLTAFVALVPGPENSSSVLIAYCALVWCSTVFLMVYLHLRYGLWGGRQMRVYVAKLVPTAAVFALVAIGLFHLMSGEVGGRSLWRQLALVGCVGTAGTVALMGAGLLLRVSSAQEIWEMVRARVLGKESRK